MSKFEIELTEAQVKEMGEVMKLCGVESVKDLLLHALEKLKECEHPDKE